MPEDTRAKIPEPDHQRLRPDQAPMPSPDELAAVRAVMNAKADHYQQARFVNYLLSMAGIHTDNTLMSAETANFVLGKRWVASTLLSMAEVRLVPLGVRKVLETQNDD